MRLSVFKKRDKRESVYLELLRSVLKADHRLKSMDQAYFLGEMEYQEKLLTSLKFISNPNELIEIIKNNTPNIHQDTLAVFILSYDFKYEVLFVLNPLELFENAEILSSIFIEKFDRSTLGELIYG